LEGVGFMKNIASLLFKVIQMLFWISVGGAIAMINVPELKLNYFLSVTLTIVKAMFAFFMPLWLVWIIFVVFLIFRYNKSFRITFENFQESLDVIDGNGNRVGQVPSPKNPILVMKCFFKNKQIELADAKSYLANKKVQEAHGRLQWTFGYAEIYKELEFINLQKLDRVVLTIVPTWTFLSWFPLVPKIKIEVRFDTYGGLVCQDTI